MFRFDYKNISFCHHLNVDPYTNTIFEKHMHPFNEIVFFLSGSLTYNVESESKVIEKGDLVLVPSGKHHFAEVDPTVDYDRYVLQFPDSVLPEYLQTKIREIQSSFTNSVLFKESFDNLDFYYNNYDNEERYILFISELCKLLIRIVKEGKTRNVVRNQSVDELVKYIDDNIDKPLTLDSLSKAFGYSKSYISNSFKEYMKVPVMRYIREKKIIAAHDLILKGEKKTYVASKFGFKDYSTFYRAYIRILGHNDINERVD